MSRLLANNDAQQFAGRITMKFLAILRDSVREAIDSKVFFVMLTLSSVMILISFTLSFKPRPGEELFKFLVFPLNTDLTDLTPEKLKRIGSFQTQGGLHVYDLKGAEPLHGDPDGPGSDFLVTLVAKYTKLEEAEKIKHDPKEALDMLQERFGAFDELRVVDITKVQLAGPDNRFVPEKPDPKEVYFELFTHPTGATRRLWPHEPSILFGAFSMSFLKDIPLGLQ